MNHEMCLSENFRTVKNRNPNPIYLACFQIAPTITTANSQPDNGREKIWINLAPSWEMTGQLISEKALRNIKTFHLLQGLEIAAHWGLDRFVSRTGSGYKQKHSETNGCEQNRANTVTFRRSDHAKFHSISLRIYRHQRANHLNAAPIFCIKLATFVWTVCCAESVGNKIASNCEIALSATCNMK